MKTTKRKALLRPQHILLCCLVVLSAFGVVLLSQNAKLAEIQQEQQALSATYEQMLLEEQRLSGMLSYVQTDEYLMQVAREKLGYVSKDDYKFYRDAPAE